MKSNLSRSLAALCLIALAAPRAWALSISETLTFSSSGSFAPSNSEMIVVQPFVFQPYDSSRPLESVSMTTTSIVSIVVQWTNTTNTAITAGVGAALQTNYANYTGFWNFGEGYTSLAPQLVTTNPGQTNTFEATFTHSTTTGANRYQAGWSPFVWNGSDPYLFTYTTFNARLGFGDTPGMPRTGTYTARETATLTYVYVTPDGGASSAMLAGACAVLFALQRRRNRTAS